jgi:hypothetical protein
VDFVSPDEIKVLLNIEAPSEVALNTGMPRPFPRIGGYVLLPSGSGFLVAQIEWITIEHSQYPKRKGMQDFGVIDLPFPLRKMKLTPRRKLSRGYWNLATSSCTMCPCGLDQEEKSRFFPPTIE